MLEIVARGDGVDAEQSSDRGECLGLEPALGQSSLERVEEVGGGDAALEHDVAGEIRPIEDAGQHGIDRAAPAVVGEVGSRDLPDPSGAAVACVGVEPVRVLGDVVGQVLVALQRRRERTEREPGEELQRQQRDHPCRRHQADLSARIGSCRLGR